MSPGYSYVLMLAAGVIGIPSLGVSVAIIYFYHKDIGKESGLKETLSNDGQSS